MYCKIHTQPLNCAMTTELPMPANEMERILNLSDFDLDYGGLKDNFRDLTLLAAKVAGTSVSLVNLIDSFTQWSVSNHGIDLDQMPREDSVCQYTIVAKEYFEVKDLSADTRFSTKGYVVEEPKLRYYFGVPLTTENGYNLGALCVLDTVGKEVSPEKIELLKIIANEIVTRLTTFKTIQDLRNKVTEARETQKKVAHDIRGPLSGIVGLAQYVTEQGNGNTMDHVLELMTMIQKGGNSLLELADEILTADHGGRKKAKDLNGTELNLIQFKENLLKLYNPQALSKGIQFSVNVLQNNEMIPFSKNKLMQITGNLISNAIKFTPRNGFVLVDLHLGLGKAHNTLRIQVKDSGSGMNEQKIKDILNGTATSSDGTSGEEGYGFGLALVKHLVDGLKGTLQIHSQPGEGAIFSISLPQSNTL